MKLFGSPPADTVPRPDLCVIGAGSAGCAAALAGVALGARVVAVDPEAPGGERVAFDAPFAVWREAARRRAEGGGAAADWAKIAVRAGMVAARAAANLSAERLTAAGVSVLIGRARFATPDRLVAGGVEIAARRFVVASGRVAVQPSAPGLELTHALTPAQALALTQRPERVVILGLGATGLALAQVFARLGAPTVALGRGAALAELSREFADPALRRLRAEGVRIVEHVDVVEVEPVGAGAGARLRTSLGETLEASHLIVAAGWRAQTEGLGLEAAGVATQDGAIVTRGDLRSSARRVFAAGAVVAGVEPDAEAAARMGRLAARSALLGLPGEAHPNAAAACWPLDPQIVRIGLDEGAASAAGGRTLRASFGEDEDARAAGRREGHLALYVDARGKLLGATLTGRDVGGAAAALSLALARGLDVAALAQAPLPGFGGLSALNRALGADLARQAREPAAARLLRWRRRWS